VGEAATKRERGKDERPGRPDGLLTTGDMARLSDNTLRTVRFYEEAGILYPDRRSAGGHRLFSHRQLDRLRFISDMRLAGLSLEQIRELLDLKPGSATGLEAADRLEAALLDQIDHLHERIRQFSRLQRELKRVHGLLRDCRRCTDADWEPYRCEDCDLWPSKSKLPQSLRVLWFPERPDADAPPKRR
jgi:DNA-binding transcriptional MerR regulator